MSIRSITVVTTIGLLAGLGLVSCFPVSLHPFVSDSDLVFDPQLLGAWADPSDADDGSWVFTEAEREEGAGKRYALVMQDGEGKFRASFLAGLGKVGDDLYLDLYPDPPRIEIDDFQSVHAIPVHSVMAVEQISPRLKLRVLDQDWLEGYLKDKPDALANTMVDDQLVITAETPALKAFLKKIRHMEGAFSDPSNMAKVPPPATEPAVEPAVVPAPDAEDAPSP